MIFSGINYNITEKSTHGNVKFNYSLLFLQQQLSNGYGNQILPHYSTNLRTSTFTSKSRGSVPQQKHLRRMQTLLLC